MLSIGTRPSLAPSLGAAFELRTALSTSSAFFR